MNKYPHVSVVISTYRRPAFLQKAILSVAQQTFTDYEVIIIHDGPIEDSTGLVCENLRTDFTMRNIEFNLVGLEENSGYQCVPKNVGIHLSRGDYIAFLDDDNEWMPEHLSELVAEIERGHDWPDFTYCRRRYVDERSDAKKAERPLVIGDSFYVPWGEKALERLQYAKTNFIDTSDLLIARGALWRMEMNNGMMWNPGTRRFGDWEMLCRGVFFNGWRGRGVDKVLSKYRWHDTNLQHTRPVNETPSAVKST